MEIIQELLPGIFVLKPPNFKDRRGSLGVPFNCVDFKAATAQSFTVSQTMTSVSKKGVLRGLHYQNDLAPVAKLVSCLRGAVYDVIVDLRIKSLSFGSWVAIELSPENGYQVYAPVGTAHGYLSLTEGSQVFYYQQGLYNAEASEILSWDDSDLNINWPVTDPVLSDRDKYGGHSWRDYANEPIF